MTAQGPGSLSGGISTAATQTPVAPSIVDRVAVLEQTQHAHGENLIQLDRIMGNLVNQIGELRSQLGMMPLEADYFNTPGADSVRF